jgi:O-antigen ligase
MDADRVTFLAPHLLNRSITAGVLVFWSVLLVRNRLIVDRRQRAFVAVALLPLPAAVLLSQHATSKLALIMAALVFGLCHWSLAAARRVILIGWLGATLLVVPLADAAYKLQLYRSSWLVPAAQHRIVIWGYTSEQVRNAPLLGVGADTARALNDPFAIGSLRAPGSSWPLNASVHSHNGYLQVWYEAGALGALCLLAIGVLMLRTLATYELAVQPYLYATFVSCAVVGGSSFSLWQPWFMASIALAAEAAGCTALAVRGSPSPAQRRFADAPLHDSGSDGRRAQHA